MKSVARLGIYCGLAAVVVGVLAASGCALINKAPVIATMEAGKDPVSVLGSTELRALAYDPDGDELSYDWLASDGTIVGTGDRATWTAPGTVGRDTITVRVSDSKGALTEKQLAIAVIPNEAPVIGSLVASQTKVGRGDCVVIDCVASDPEQDSLTYTWSASDGGFSRTGPVTIWKAPNTLGNFTITVKVSDDKGGETTSELTVEVTLNQPPVIKSLTSKDSVVVYGDTTTVTCNAFDPDADDLTYVWTAAEGTLTGAGATVEWAAPNVCGQYVPIDVTVFDGHGGEASQEIKIQTRKPG